MTRKAPSLVLLLVSFDAAGCLRKETAHTLYLSPDGSLLYGRRDRRLLG